MTSLFQLISGLLPILILLDITAALDTTSHHILLHKLTSIGITDTALKPQTSLAIQFVQLCTHRSVHPIQLQCALGLCAGAFALHYLSPAIRKYLQET